MERWTLALVISVVLTLCCNVLFGVVALTLLIVARNIDSEDNQESIMRFAWGVIIAAPIVSLIFLVIISQASQSLIWSTFEGITNGSGFPVVFSTL